MLSREFAVFPAYMFRLYYTEFMSESFIISMDTDIYAGRHFFPELMGIIENDANNSLVYGVRDENAEFWISLSLNVTLSRYINSGFFVIRNNREGKELMLVARRLFLQNLQIIKCLDQDAINLALNSCPWSLHLLPGYFNCHYGWCMSEQLEEQAIHHQKFTLHSSELNGNYQSACKAKGQLIPDFL
jgi:hypothetical protein